MVSNKFLTIFTLELITHKTLIMTIRIKPIPTKVIDGVDYIKEVCLTPFKGSDHVYYFRLSADGHLYTVTFDTPAAFKQRAAELLADFYPNLIISLV